MSTKVRSARGVMVDFDLLRIKSQMSPDTKPVVVQAREDFIDQKFKRRIQRLKNTVAPPAELVSAVEQTEVTAEQTVEATVVDETLAAVDTPATAPTPKAKKSI